MNDEQQLAILSQGTEEILPQGALLERLRLCGREARPLRVKQGFDPTAPDIHLGHTVGLRKLRQFQDLGHQVVLIVGDYTGMVGDPSGLSKTRPQLSAAEVEANARTYLEQFFRVLERDPRPPRRPVEVHRNGEWFARMTFVDVITLMSQVTLARMLERDDFARRYAAQQPISLHELLYPLMQGYDSVAIRADLELGATEQKFNLLVGRALQEIHGQPPQIILTVPVLPGLDGVQRMSKSLGNYIGVTDPPGEMFGKVMKINDDLMWRYYDLLSFRPLSDIRRLRDSVDQGANPRDIKMELGVEIVSRFHGAGAGEQAKAAFIAQFSQGALPDQIQEVTLAAPQEGLPLARVLKEAGLVSSTSDANRQIQQRAVRVDQQRVEDRGLMLKPGATYLLQVGPRRFARVTLVFREA